MIDTDAQIAMFRELLDSIEHHMNEVLWLQERLSEATDRRDDGLPF
jgi:hypothetical protein